MALDSFIEWTDSTWNPVTGCTKISPGCKHCYAERMATRLVGMGQPRYRNGFEVTLQPDLVRLPLRWRRPRVIFVNSMSDLFHIERLRAVPAAVRFLSLEPLLAPISSLPVDGIDWVIVGGESGPGARPMAADWVRQIRNRCARDGVAFFFKQWGGTRKKQAGRLLDGRTWDEMPASVLRQPWEDDSRLISDDRGPMRTTDLATRPCSI